MSEPDDDLCDCGRPAVMTLEWRNRPFRLCRHCYAKAPLDDEMDEDDFLQANPHRRRDDD